MKKTAPLLSEFANPSMDQWRAEVERLLKGAPFAKKMFTRTWEGISVSPLYTEADTQDIPWRDSLPGQAPFVRGNRAAGYHAAPWLVAQENISATCDAFNAATRRSLTRGQTAVNLVFDLASKLGKDPDQVTNCEVGLQGTSVSSLMDLAVALEDIDLARYPLFIQSGGSALPVAAMVVALIRSRDGDLTQLRGCLGSDPYSGLSGQGQIMTSVDQIHDELATLTKWMAVQAPEVRTLPIFERSWHDGGADLALSLGLTLSSAVATLRAMEARGIALETAAPRFQFNLEVGTDFFMEMAKLRALRLLWSRILTASGVPAADTGTFIHTRTARRSQTVLDAHVNLLRGTTGAMSAVLGGTDSLHVSPFDAVDRLPDRFSRRIARNVQLILAQECHLDQVTDPAGGSWYVDSLTRDLASAAWQKFQAAEAAGGMPKVLASGWAQQQVAAAAAERAEGYASRKHVLVGTNMYPDPAATPRPKGEVDCEQLRGQRSAALAGQRQSETQEAHMLVLARLEKLMDCPPEVLFERMTDAAEAGATLGEITGVLRDGGDPGLDTEPVPLRRDGEPFEELVSRRAAVAEQQPAAGRVHTVCLGDYARYMPRLEFVRGFFRVGGFEVTGDEFHTEPQAAVGAARADGARTVVLVGLDETYAAQAAAVAQALSEGPEPPLILLAGAPGETETELRGAGLSGFIHMRSNVLTALNSVLDKMEGQS